MTRQLADVKAPLGEELAPQEQLASDRKMLEGPPTVFECRFLTAADDAGAIADRAFNAERRAAALSPGNPASDFSARWEPSNPNVLTMSDGRGNVIETKVTKRSFEAPQDGAFGTSEYARIAGGHEASTARV